MSIEFPCSECGKLLRVGDDASGKQARCPSCGSVQAIPFTSPSAGPMATGPSEDPFGGHWAQPAGDPLSPYASPASIPEMPSPAPFGEYRGPRSGPPWERDGASFQSFVATLKQAYSAPQMLFTEMRREGGFWSPLSFALAGGVVGGLAAGCYNIGVQFFAMQAANNQGNLAGQAPGIQLAIMAVFIVIMVPIGIVIQAFVTSGIYHLCLMMLGGANQPYETTFRVVNYSAGAAGLLGLIPLCGAAIQGIYALVLTGIGLAYGHETSGAKATFAILLPVIVCCGAMLLLYGAIIALVVANAR